MEEIKKIEVQGQQYGVADMLMRSVMGGNAQVIAWSHTNNMNDYKDAGTYRIKGERTGNPLDDNLPIMNQGSGHTIAGILYVFDSSLTNGSGKSDDCTVTQFLMLSNRVGGQEGDMYMRSAYGANKDSLIWKPWEKYQTNMEVGCVSDWYTLNPSNPTQAISDKGMYHLTDNGIYSGIYFPPKAMIGTPSEGSAVIQDETAVETFVMVVINNYAAASNARCITQIKFAVTNGGVFSMEKRSTQPGTFYFSQWESVGGGRGLPENVIFYQTGQEDKYYFGYTSPESVAIGSGLVIGNNVKIGGGVAIGNSLTLGENVIIEADMYIFDGYIHGQGQSIKFGTGIEIGNRVKIGDDVKIHVSTPEQISTLYIGQGAYQKGSFSDICLGEAVKIGDVIDIKDGAFIGAYANLGAHSTIGDEVSIEKGIEIYKALEEDKIVFRYNGKTAELPLT